MYVDPSAEIPRYTCRLTQEQYATSFLQSVYYGITIRAGEPRPQPGTPRYDRHRRRIFIFVVTSYLLYTLYETFHQVQVAGDYYKVLGVSPFADERTIKSRFRRLAAQHHPDKIGPDAGSDGYFMFLRKAQETLVDPVKRFAYDRFGPTMSNMTEKKTMRELLTDSLTTSTLPQYVGGLATMIVVNWLWWSNWGRYVSSTINCFYSIPDIELTNCIVALLHLWCHDLPRAGHDHPSAGHLHANSLPAGGRPRLAAWELLLPSPLPDLDNRPPRFDYPAHLYLADLAQGNSTHRR